MSEHKSKLGFVAKTSLSIGLLVLISTASVGLWTYYRLNTSLVDEELTNLSQHAENKAVNMSHTIEEMQRDLLYLSTTPPIQGIIRCRRNSGIDTLDRSTEQQWINRLTHIFNQMLRANPQYYRIRYIGVADGGREILRTVTERVSGGSENGKLAQWKNVDWFVKTLRLPTGEIFYSDLNLRREHGVIVQPYTAVLRAATPIYTPDNQRYGVVVLDMFIEKVFETLQAGISARQQLYVFNDDGYYLMHPDREKTFGFEFGRRYRVQDDYPMIGEMIEDAIQAQATVKSQDQEELVLGAHRLHFDPAYPQRYLGFMVATPYQMLVGDAIRARNEIFAVIGVLMLVASIVGLVISRNVLNQVGGEPSDIEAITRRVADGDLNIEFRNEERHASGIWGSVIAMVKSLRQTQQENVQQRWLSTELARIISLCHSKKELVDVAQTVISELSKLVDAGHGAFYIRKMDANIKSRKYDELSFALMGSFAFNRRKENLNLIKVGDGIVGQCALEKQSILLTDVPSDYVQINSGLGKKAPLNLIAVPILFEGVCLGVVELAAFKEFSEAGQQLVGQVCSNLGVIIDNVFGRQQTEALMEEAQRLAEESQAQSEELEAANEEMEQKSQELQAINGELEEKSEQLLAANEELEEKSQLLKRQKKDVEKKNEEIEKVSREIALKAAEVETASKYKSEFLANMSHELRTPLNSLLILAKTLSENNEGNLTGDQVESANVIYDGGVDLLNLINDILDLSKVEAGKMEIVREEVNLPGLLESVKKQFTPMAQQKGLALTIEIDAQLPPVIETDRHRLSQVLKNLLSNAFKFTEKGSVTISYRRPEAETTFRSDILSAGESVAIAIGDTGIGIPVEKQKAVFEAFQQADGSISRKFGGTGLGLTISRELADLLGGEIHLESDSGSGSTFTLYLPLQRKTAPEVHSTSSASQPVGQNADSDTAAPVLLTDDRHDISEDDKSILIIEDEIEFARILKDLAQQKGYKCVVCNDGRSGLKLAGQLQPSAIILDIGLPDIGGLSVLDYLKDDLRTRHIPVHVISGEAENSAALHKGAVGYLTKPVSMESINVAFEKIENVLHSDIKELLLIEDEPATQEAVVKLLKDKGVNITVAGTGEEAFEHLNASEYDCMILDLQLPDISGIELLQKLRENEARHTPPVIVYTAKEVSKAEHQVLSEYTESFVIKGAGSPERLVDETSLFLHSVEARLPENQRKIVRMLHEPDRMLQGRKVLLVDDDMRNTFALSKILRTNGMEVIMADNGQFALEQLANQTDVELVLMDIMMPVMDGYQAMQKIRSQELFRDLPIIALTAKAMPEDRKKCINAGASDYLTKPVDIDQLLSMMRVWLHK